MIFETLSSQETTYSLDMVTSTKDGLGIEEVTTGEAAQTQMVEDALEGTRVVIEILKSPRTPRPKKDKQEKVVGFNAIDEPHKWVIIWDHFAS